MDSLPFEPPGKPKTHQGTSRQLCSPYWSSGTSHWGAVLSVRSGRGFLSWEGSFRYIITSIWEGSSWLNVSATEKMRAHLCLHLHVCVQTLSLSHTHTHTHTHRSEATDRLGWRVGWGWVESNQLLAHWDPVSWRWEGVETSAPYTDTYTWEQDRQMRNNQRTVQGSLWWSTKLCRAEIPARKVQRWEWTTWAGTFREAMW